MMMQQTKVGLNVAAVAAAAGLLVGSMNMSSAFAGQAGRQADPEAQAEGKKLGVGDKAPKLDVEHWIKGDKVSEFKSDNVYVVEFWATWCPPCRTSMPHLSELQEKYEDKNVRIIGISDEPYDKVKDFLTSEDWPEKTQYTLATDPDRSVFNDYMRAAGQNGIPTAFIVGKDNKVQWIGHPMNMDEPLAKVVDGTWDPMEYQRQFERQRQAAQARQEVFQDLQSGNEKAAMEKLDRLIDEGNTDLRFLKFQLLISQMNKSEEAWQTARIHLEESWDDASALNEIAWFVATNPQVKERNLRLARMAALRASELTNYEDANILDTLARVHHENGEHDKAVRIQRMAVEHAEGEQAREQFRMWLDRYMEAADDNQEDGN